MAESDCQHINAFKDDFLGEWHCDDCGAALDGPPTSEDK